MPSHSVVSNQEKGRQCEFLSSDFVLIYSRIARRGKLGGSIFNLLIKVVGLARIKALSGLREFWGNEESLPDNFSNHE